MVWDEAVLQATAVVRSCCDIRMMSACESWNLDLFFSPANGC